MTSTSLINRTVAKNKYIIRQMMKYLKILPGVNTVKICLMRIYQKYGITIISLETLLPQSVSAVIVRFTNHVPHYLLYSIIYETMICTPFALRVSPRCKDGYSNLFRKRKSVISH